ncbi:MAG: hypothetical protein Q7R64_01305 [bacterium]|nr:hypothetical protein [bacterium]
MKPKIIGNGKSTGERSLEEHNIKALRKMFGPRLPRGLAIARLMRSETLRRVLSSPPQH